MCLPRIGEIVAVDGLEALVSTPGERHARVSLLCVPDAGVGDHVMIHAGHAIELLDASDAEQRQILVDEVTGRADARGDRR